MIYFKIVTPENYCCEFFHIIGIGKRSAPCYQKSSLFFSHVKWCNAIGHNVTGILNLAWAVTSEPMKIKSRFLVLWRGYDLTTGLLKDCFKIMGNIRFRSRNHCLLFFWSIFPKESKIHCISELFRQGVYSGISDCLALTKNLAFHSKPAKNALFRTRNNKKLSIPKTTIATFCLITIVGF